MPSLVRRLRYRWFILYKLLLPKSRDTAQWLGITLGRTSSIFLYHTTQPLHLRAASQLIHRALSSDLVRIREGMR